MAKELKLRKGTATEHSTFVGAEAEITVNTTNKSLHIHDGITANGFEAARVDLGNITNETFAAKATSAGISGGEGGGSVSGADPDATYLVVTAAASLPNERRLQAAAGVVLNDGGAGGALTVGVVYSGSAPANLGSAATGASNAVARADHVHALPTTTAIGAVPTARTVIAGAGLSGGGALSSNVTLTLSAGLADLTDVTTNTLLNGDVLIYNSATSQFENFPSSSFGRMTIKDEGVTVGLANAITQINFVGSGVLVETDGSNSNLKVTVEKAYTAEEIQDIVGGMVTGNTETGISVVYNDATEGTGKLNFTTNNFAVTLAGAVQGTATVSGLSNITINTTMTPNAIVLGTDTSGAYVRTVAGSSNGITVAGGSSESADITIGLNTAETSFVEAIQDIVGGMVTGNTETGITVSYFDDVAGGLGKLNFSMPTTNLVLDGAVTGNGVLTLGSTLTITTSSNIDFANSTVIGNYVRTVATDSTANGIVVTNGAATGADAIVSLNLGAATFVEGIQDIAATLFTTTHSGITAVYDDTLGKMTLDVNDFSMTLTGPITGTATVTNLGNTSIATSLAANAVTLGTHTAGNYVATIAGSGPITVTGSGSESAAITVSLDDTNTAFKEAIQDIVGTMVTSNTQNGITVSYFDDVGLGGGKLNFQTPNTTVTLVGAVSGSATISNGASISITTVANSITLGANTIGNYVASVSAAAVANGIVVVGSAAEGSTPTVALDLSAVTFVEGVEDIVAGLFSRATHSGITAVYDDTLAKITLDVADFTVTVSGAVTGSATITNLGNATLATTLAANAVTLGTHTTGNYLMNLTGSNGLVVTGTGVETADAAITIDGTNTSFREIIQDIVGTMVTGNTANGVTVTYFDDATVGVGKLNFQTPNTAVTLAGAVTGTATIVNGGAITITTVPAANALTLGTHTAGDYVATIVAGTTPNGIVVTGAGESAAATVRLDMTASTFVEGVEDLVAGLFSRATHSGITAIYDDALAKITLDVNDFSITLTGVVTGSTTITNLANGSIATTLAANSVTLGTHTTGNYLATATGTNGVTVSGSGAQSAAITIGLDSTNTALQEIIQDIVGTMVTNGTKTKMTATYTDGGVGAGVLNFGVSDGAGSGLDADLLDGFNSTYYTDIVSRLGFTPINSLSGAFVSAGGSTGGAFSMAKPGTGTTLTAGAQFAISGDSLLIYHADGTANKGVQLNLLSCGNGASSILWHSGNDGSGSGLDADVLRGAVPSTAATASTIAQRDSSGNLTAGVFNGTATTARYADVAERYEADAIYEPGTVMVFGGNKEITQCLRLDDTRSAGVISTAPAYMMNSGAGSDETHPYVALVGRVPCKVKGPIRKGDLLTTSDLPGHAEPSLHPMLGTIIGKALENFDGETGVIEISVQRS